MENGNGRMDTVIEVCKRRGIIYPTAEIYGSMSGFWDYGPIGCRIKQKIENYWRESFLEVGTNGDSCISNIVEIDGSTVLPESVLAASGHVDGFVDPISQCKKCKSIHRADHLIEDATGKFVEGKSGEELTKIIRKEGIKCPSCKGEMDDVRVFNLMLKTEIGAAGGNPAYLRPETAQNIFTSFNRVVKSSRAKLPFGIAQIGHSFRNEISPRNFIIRVREFNQLEIEMFIDPGNPDDCPGFEEVKDVELNFFSHASQKKGGKTVKVTAEDALRKKLIPNKFLAYFMAKEMKFYTSVGIKPEYLRHRHMLPEETPHYSKGNFDMEIKFDFGWKETVGNAYRGDYDLSKHAKHSKTNLSVTTDDGRKVIPYVVEPSFGMERTLAGILLHCFREDKKRGWDWFAFPPKIAPYTAAVLPLMKKDGLPEKALDICKGLNRRHDVFYDESGSIGKRYARMDEIGVPYCITIDHQSLEDGTITVRDRDTMKQVRVEANELFVELSKLVEGGTSLDNIGKPVN